MTNARRPNLPFGWATFCDDIRDEVGGKQTFVGIYSDLALFSGVSFPVTVPKLCVSILYFEDTENLPETLTFSVYLPGEDEDQPARFSTTLNLKDGTFPVPSRGDTLVAIKPQFVLSPLTINAEGRIKVRVNRDDDTIKLGSLLMKADGSKNNESENNPSAA